MAEFILLRDKERDATTFGCYSERGFLSYYMFRFLPKKRYLKNLLSKIEFVKKGKNPFLKRLKTGKLSNVLIFGELNFNKFGSPDGMIFFNFNNEPYLIFLEAKFNETYKESSNKKYSSSIKGQLELKWRMIYSYFNSEKNGSIIEPEDLKKLYKNDAETNGKRKLTLKDGVKEVFLHSIDKMGEHNNNILFLAMTDDKQIPKEILNNPPRIHDYMEKGYLNKFCWIGVKYTRDFLGNRTFLLKK